MVMKSAYVQKYVPGQENENVISYLFIDFEIIDPDITLERVLYNEHSSPLSTIKRPIKIDWEKGDREQGTHLESNQAIIYYSKGEKKYKLLVEDIETKDDLFLP